MHPKFSIADAKKDLAAIMDKVSSGSRVVLRQENGKDVVLLSVEEFESLNETLYFLQSPANAQRLRESIQSLTEAEATAS
ncbi:type II toxin-antitoxin system Phd/YefM family antitoxin [Desulfobaculum bizertense]|uniref:Antitoxin n=1 Tax=Desulfobaculum bizertense DSM 18034 TaxID=1121442 RepID=A0A1T4W0W4_9BACT|nr:type II toxin-antitoxin system prevent-host-death family antitoxin [Desulfobaculum bizertense]SKA70896.1 antitoxin YefM [Desulfobaculum bizertense DSM 18034]